MDQRNLRRYLDATLIGRVMLTELLCPHLEVFSRNALCCRRGMSTMNKYKTVKEVCALTGLTGKHLYYFHHEKVVRAAAYANYSVEGYDGYKLYDDAAIEKLHQIALYYQLGLKRNEIRNIMLDPDYDSNLILETLLTLEQDKKLHIERNIAALEYLTLTGTKNGVTGSLQGISLDDLGRTLLAIREASEKDDSSPAIKQENAETFAKEFAALVSELSDTDTALLKDAAGTKIIRQIFELGAKFMGTNGCPFILGLFMSSLGEGSIAQEFNNKLTPLHGKAVIEYIVEHPEVYTRDPRD